MKNILFAFYFRRALCLAVRSFRFSRKMSFFLAGMVVACSGFTAARADYASAVKASDPVVYYRFDSIYGRAQPNFAMGPSAVNMEAKSQNTPVLLSGKAGPRPSDGFRGFDSKNEAATYAGNETAHQQFLIGGNALEVLSGASGTSVEFWIKPAVKPSNEVGLFLIPQESGGQGLSIRYTPEGILLGANPSQDKFQAVLFKASLAPDTWYHFAAVFNYGQKTLSLYVNGELNATKPATDWRSSKLGLTNTKDFQTIIGKWGNLADFEGSLDEFALYKRALRTEEVADHYAKAVVRNP